MPAFLYRLFSDPDVIRVRPAPLRKAIAAAIAAGRAGASRELYASIGGGSPIRRLTEQQAAGAERLLRAEGRDVVVRGRDDLLGAARRRRRARASRPAAWIAFSPCRSTRSIR